MGLVDYQPVIKRVDMSMPHKLPSLQLGCRVDLRHRVPSHKADVGTFRLGNAMGRWWQRGRLRIAKPAVCEPLIWLQVRV
jgi:hypothetical protein